MSIFKIKQWWSNATLQDNDFYEGIQNGSCITVDKFNCHNDSDCVIVGEGPLLKIYKPDIDKNSSHAILESQLNDVILQIETGKFIADCDDQNILILHPKSYIICQLRKKTGHLEPGDQNLVQVSIKHSFTRRACNMTIGSFGNSKSRHLICIQALDGTLSFFDQDTFLFMCIFNDNIIPGPICYVPSSDLFILCKSTWVLEIYSYQQFAEFSELNVRQNKKNIPQWAYNAGEEILHVQVIRTSTNFSSIVALGEKHLYCFQDNGLMKYMIRFDFMPLCFHAYIIGWYYEPGSRLLVMVASDDCKLYIYEGTTQLWSCDLLHKPISILRCFFKALPGALVALGKDGIINVSYLGTEPDLNSNTSAVCDSISPQQVQTELETTEESLKKILEEKEDIIDPLTKIETVIKIKADVGKPVQNLFQPFDKHGEPLNLLMCPIIAMITCEEPNHLQSVQITYHCSPPFACSESTICLDSINGTEIVETHVFLISESDIPESKLKILFTIIDNSGKIVVISRELLLPLSLYCMPVEAASDSSIKLCINTNYPCIDFGDIFTDFTKEELLSVGNSTDSVTFAYRTTKETITLRSTGSQYQIESQNFTEIPCMLDHFLYKLRDHCTRTELNNVRITFNLNSELLKQLTQIFFKCIDVHVKERIKLKKLDEEMNVLQRQFTVIQKKLLVQYGSLPPGDCDPLEFLMKDTHKRLVKKVEAILQSQQSVSRAGITLMTICKLIINFIKHQSPDDFKTKLIEEMLSLDPLHEQSQEWEEAVTQASSYLINHIFKKSVKDKEKLTTVTDQEILSHINIKRFIKQMRIILEKVFAEICDDISSSPSDEKVSKITRIEELVEVL